MKTHLLFLAILFVSLLNSSAQNSEDGTQRLAISGGTRWQTYPDQNKILIEVGRVTYNGSSNSGTVKIVVWATTTPYQPGTKGWALGEYRLGVMQPRHYNYNIRQTVPYTRPPVGHYYVSILVQEYNSSGGWRTQAFTKGTRSMEFR